MLILKTIFCIGLLAIAGGCGYILGWLEKKATEEKRNKLKRRIRQ